MRMFFVWKQISNFSLITFGFVIFGTKILYQKRARKMLMKLTAGLNINMAVFYNLGSDHNLLRSITILKLVIFWVPRFGKTFIYVLMVIRIDKMLKNTGLRYQNVGPFLI